MYDCHTTKLRPTGSRVYTAPLALSVLYMFNSYFLAVPYVATKVYYGSFSLLFFMYATARIRHVESLSITEILLNPGMDHATLIYSDSQIIKVPIKDLSVQFVDPNRV